MQLSLGFFLQSVMLGAGLAMDAFSVSLVNGLNEPTMGRGKMAGVAGIFALFQWAMPLAGWFLVHTVAQQFSAFEKCIPWIALLLLGYIGGKMIYEARQPQEETAAAGQPLHFATLLAQGVATSIDALSVGFTIAHYGFFMAMLCCVIIGAVTWAICLTGLSLGKKAGVRLAGRAGILGGAILIAIGIEIFAGSFL